jgi:hypothetical protein
MTTSNEWETLPYINTYFTPTDLATAWQHAQRFYGTLQRTTSYTLRNVVLDTRFQNDYVLIREEPGTYYRFNFITDYFTEPARLAARRYNQHMSPQQIWQHAIQTNHFLQKLSRREQREWLYKHTVEASNFRLSVAITLLDIFKPKSIFDPCAGHGDRAIAALSRSYVESYTACEPNTASQPLIVKAIDTLSAKLQTGKDKKSFYVHLTPFEDFKWSTSMNEVDMIFTSPPYGDTEIYCDEETQSIKRYPTFTQWYNDFLLPMFQSCWQHLRTNGHMIISINNVYDPKQKALRFHVVEQLVADITRTCSNANWLGIIGITDDPSDKRIEPLFVWRKDSHPHIHCLTTPKKRSLIQFEADLAHKRNVLAQAMLDTRSPSPNAIGCMIIDYLYLDPTKFLLGGYQHHFEHAALSAGISEGRLGKPNDYIRFKCDTRHWDRERRKCETLHWEWTLTFFVHLLFEQDDDELTEFQLVQTLFDDAVKLKCPIPFSKYALINRFRGCAASFRQSMITYAETSSPS